MCSLTEAERNLSTSICQIFWKNFQKFICNLINWSLLLSKPSVCESKKYQPTPYNIHTRSDLNSLPCIWEKRNNRIKDPEPLKFCRRFERFAANLVQCLSAASFARKICESATVQNGEHKFLVWILYPIISFFSYTITRLPFKFHITKWNTIILFVNFIFQ